MLLVAELLAAVAGRHAQNRSLVCGGPRRLGSAGAGDRARHPGYGEGSPPVRNRRRRRNRDSVAAPARGWLRPRAGLSLCQAVASRRRGALARPGEQFSRAGGCVAARVWSIAAVW